MVKCILWPVLAETVLQVVEKLELRKNNNTLLRKAAVKVIQRLGLTFLKARVASWRYVLIYLHVYMT